MKFTTLDLAGHFNLSVAGLTAPEGTERRWHPDLPTQVAALPCGEQSFWGVPFRLACEAGPRWVELRAGEPVIISVGAEAGYLVFAHFCNASVDADDVHERPDVRVGFVTRPGEHLADYTIAYGDGTEHTQPIRRRFEINEPTSRYGQLAFAARPHSANAPRPWQGPYPDNDWGAAQTSVVRGDYVAPVRYWIYALPNPHPDKKIAATHLQAIGKDRLAIAGLTLHHGLRHPLQHRRLEGFRLTLPQSHAVAPDQLAATIDLGIIARQYAVPAFRPEEWLSEELQGWGAPRGESQPDPRVDRITGVGGQDRRDHQASQLTADFRLDITASPDATLTVQGHAIELGPVYDHGCGVSTDGGARLELLDRERTWVHVTIRDQSTGLVTPARVHMRTPDGRYLPPYGHRHEVNDNWFEDYGADLKLGSTQYAYVDGRFQVELPVGEIYFELCKGFEYQPLRQRVDIRPGQRELTLFLQRPYDLRREGWVTADTHVHFISPQTAWLEAQAEGLNLINLLASQWGDLYTNVGDLSGGQSGVSTSDTIVWVSTENRQHILGHLSLLGVNGSPIFPMTTAGPGESYLGDPIESSLAEWADRCRAQEGVTVLPHFPNPYCEAAADIILGKIDGVEVRYFTPHFDNYQLGEWYRFLNLGYRVAAVGGTDKMSAGMPVGGVRTYAHLGDQEFTFQNWGRAVRAGRTFTSSGPLIGVLVDGRRPGDEIHLPAGGGTLDVSAWADSVLPIHALQLVVNGKVVDQSVEEAGARHIALHSRVRLSGSAWVAARCLSRLVAWHSNPVNVAAHTSPVYVVAGDQELFNPSDATFMLTLLDGGLTYLDTLSIPASEEKQERIRSVFRQAQAELHRRMHAHGHSHPK